jgi:hypothetical protein
METRTLTFSALMAALSNILSFPPFIIPIALGPFSTSIHFTQVPILLSGILAGPWAGLISGGVGGIYMSMTTGIPFIIGGLALLGSAAGYFSNKYKIHPFISSLAALCLYIPYVFLTDYIWFTSTRLMTHIVAMGVIQTIIMKLTVEVLIASIIISILLPYIRRVYQ